GDVVALHRRLRDELKIVDDGAAECTRETPEEAIVEASPPTDAMPSLVDGERRDQRKIHVFGRDHGKRGRGLGDPEGAGHEGISVARPGRGLLPGPSLRRSSPRIRSPVAAIARSAAGASPRAHMTSPFGRTIAAARTSSGRDPTLGGSAAAPLAVTCPRRAA